MFSHYSRWQAERQSDELRARVAEPGRYTVTPDEMAILDPTYAAMLHGVWETNAWAPPDYSGVDWDWPPRWYGTVSMVRLPAYASQGCADEVVNLVHTSWGISKPRWRGWTTAEILAAIKANLQ